MIVGQCQNCEKLLLLFLFILFHPPLLLSQDVTPLAAPDHQGNHGKCEENRDEDEDGNRVIRRVHQHHLLVGAVGEKVLVYADDVALHQGIGPVTVHGMRLIFCAKCEYVVLTEEEKREEEKEKIRGKSPLTPEAEVFFDSQICISTCASVLAYFFKRWTQFN